MGLPVFMVALLYKNSVALRTADSAPSMMFAFFVKDYDEKHYYWERVLGDAEYTGGGVDSI